MQTTQDQCASDRAKHKTYRLIALLLALVGGIGAIALATRGQIASPLFVISALMVLAGCPLAYAADKIERAYDVETRAEVQAFVEGQDPDQIERDRTGSQMSRRMRRSLPTIAAAAAFLVVAAALAMFFATL